jgi:hypothetical protein
MIANRTLVSRNRVGITVDAANKFSVHRNEADGAIFTIVQRRRASISVNHKWSSLTARRDVHGTNELRWLMKNSFLILAAFGLGMFVAIQFFSFDRDRERNSTGSTDVDQQPDRNLQSPVKVV